MAKLRLTRTVSPDEYSWLDKTYEEGEEIFKYTGYTYGCISRMGIACSEVEGEIPFFELPMNALDVI